MNRHLNTKQVVLFIALLVALFVRFDVGAVEYTRLIHTGKNIPSEGYADQRYIV